MRISDWSSDVCSSDLATVQPRNVVFLTDARLLHQATTILAHLARKQDVAIRQVYVRVAKRARLMIKRYAHAKRSEEHTSELQSLMRISYAVFCLKKKKATQTRHST